jgi:hypothetical protein
LRLPKQSIKPFDAKRGFLFPAISGNRKRSNNALSFDHGPNSAPEVGLAGVINE